MILLHVLTQRIQAQHHIPAHNTSNCGELQNCTGQLVSQYKGGHRSHLPLTSVNSFLSGVTFVALPIKILTKSSSHTSVMVVSDLCNVTDTFPTPVTTSFRFLTITFKAVSAAVLFRFVDSNALLPFVLLLLLRLVLSSSSSSAYIH